ncbi:MAG: hypothetical protein JWO74_4190 [Solirubrobacterales bacterium]|nr:hypothetical protein [Solirubrobacterales bacterium]
MTTTTTRPAFRSAQSRALAWLARERLTVFAVAVYGCLYLVLLSFTLNQDGWLALATGRQIAQHGLPSADTLMAYTTGVRWVDQQWLAQLAIYGAQQLGGLRTLALLHVALALFGVSVAVVTARRGGASPLAVVAVALPAFVPISFVAEQIRTQIFGVVMFALVVSLLIRDARSRSARVWWTLPLVALWSNLHGSVALGAGLVALRGLTIAVPAIRSRGRDRRVGVARGFGLAAGATVAVFASPYGPHMLEYYRHTALNPAFGKLVAEWMPATPSASTATFYLLAFLGVWSFGRRRSALTSYEWLVLLVTGLSTMSTVRSAGWFAMAALMTLPVALTPSLPAPKRPAGLSQIPIASVPLAILVALGVSAAGRSDEWFQQHYPAALDNAVGRAIASAPGARVFADVRYSDWLLWRRPELAGRLAFDARYELLTASQLQTLHRFNHQVGDNWRAAARGYRIIVVDRRLDQASDGLAPTYLQLLKGPGSKLVYLSKDSAVILNPA